MQDVGFPGDPTVQRRSIPSEPAVTNITDILMFKKTVNDTLVKR